MPVPQALHPYAERQQLHEILDWYHGIADALLEHRASVQRSMRDNHRVSGRFAGMTEADVDTHFDAQRRELDRLTILNLVACAEAEIVTDYERRVRGKLKDPLSRAYQTWHKSMKAKMQLRPAFDEPGILGVLKKSKVINNHIIGDYRSCLQARHWLGHGRRWDKPVAVDRFDPEDVYVRAQTLVSALAAVA